MKQQRNRKFWAMLLAAALIVIQLPAVVMAENNTPEKGSIASFEPSVGNAEENSGIDSSKPSVDSAEENGGIDTPKPPDGSAEEQTVPNGAEEPVITEGDNEEGAKADASAAVSNGADESITDRDGEQTSVKDSGETVTTVTAFDELDGVVRYQQIPLNTPESVVNLPAALGASGYKAAGGGEPVPEPIRIDGVTWELVEKNGSLTAWEEGRDTPCTYYFQPVLPEGYQPAGDVTLPEIEVRYGMEGVALRAGAVPYDANGYHDGDVKAFQEILKEHPSLLSGGVDRDDPASWDGAVVRWNASSNPKRITELKLRGKNLTGELDVSGLTGLCTLYCDENRLTGLKVGSQPELYWLNCEKNQLTVLDVSGLTGLTTLSCSKNQLQSLNVSGLTKLTDLYCDGNQLTKLELSDLKELSGLYCYDNRLPVLDVSGLTKLTTLDCEKNLLKVLDVSSLTALNFLGCKNNPLVSFKTKDGYTLTVNHGVGGAAIMTKFIVGGNRVELAATPDNGYRFKEWESLPAGVSNTERTSFSVTANTTVNAVFAVSVTGVSLDYSAYTLYTDKAPGSFKLNAAVTPDNADDRSVSWSSSNSGVASVDADGTVTAHTAGTAVITATTGDGGKTAVCNVTVKTAAPPNGGSSSSGGNLSSGSNPSSGGSSSAVYEPQSSYTVAGDKISQNVSCRDLKLLADSGKSLSLRCDKAGMTFEPAALYAILAATTGAGDDKVIFTAVLDDISAYPEASVLFKGRPVYDFAVSCKDGSGQTAAVQVNFPAGSASIALSYAPASNEVTGSLFMVYVDGTGALTWLDKSSYVDGRMLADVSHFSTYGVACKAPAPVFTDIMGHWAKEDIEFAAARGLLSGTDKTRFSPDAAMTRGMFVTALGRLAGVNPDSYQTRSFTDVKADAYYAAYVEWAVQQSLAGATGDRLFCPDAPVTREQMAVMMAACAGQMGYSLSAPLVSVTFADSDKISAWAAKEVAAMQRAGVIKAKDGNRFEPQENATRAEASAALRRFVETAIDSAAAQGFTKNDSGHLLYYKEGKALTGWQTIDKQRYYFNTDGVMAVSTEIDGYEVSPPPAPASTAAG